MSMIMNMNFPFRKESDDLEEPKMKFPKQIRSSF